MKKNRCFFIVLFIISFVTLFANIEKNEAINIILTGVINNQIF